MSIQVAIPLFPRFTALDGIGPYEVLQRIPEIDITFIAEERGIVRSDNGMLGIQADGTYDDFPDPDVVVFPGGPMIEYDPQPPFDVGSLDKSTDAVMARLVEYGQRR